jgi:multidrug efflux pump
VPVPGGRTVALSQFATFSFTQEQPLVWRRDRVPTLTVLADVANGHCPRRWSPRSSRDIAALDASLPVGYGIEIGGTAETSAESQESVFAVVPLMAFLMLTLLMIQLQRLQGRGHGGDPAAARPDRRGRRAADLRPPLGFVAILGILALIGMIAKNAVILITQITDERAAGLGVARRWSAAPTACGR